MKTFTWFKRFVVALSLLLVTVALPLYGYKVYTKTDYTDFSVYYRAAARAHSGLWDQIYTLADGASPFRYVPCTLPFFSPFALFPAQEARLAWYFFQVLCFLGGFCLLSRTLRLIAPKNRNHHWILALSFLFILRFCLDSFTIGQITPLMFLGFSLSLYAWTLNRPALASLGLFLPALIKIGPALSYGLFASSRRRYLRIGAWVAFLVTGAAFTAGWFWTRSTDLYLSLWRRWLFIVRSDSVYYDASHYGSQSIKSALLRFSKDGFFAEHTAHWLWLLATVLLVSSTVLFWFFRRPIHFRSRGLFFSLGLFTYLWIMPETFKYAFVFLAFPVALLLSTLQERRSAFTLFSLVFGALVLSSAGKDFMPDILFFRVQQMSLPLLATIFLGIATFIHAARESTPSVLSRTISELLLPSFLGPWKRLPVSAPSLEFSLLLPVQMDEHRPPDVYRLLTYLKDASQTLGRLTSASYEIVIVFFGNRASRFHPAFEPLAELSRDNPSVRLNFASSPSGRSAAIRDAFLFSRGKVIGLSHFEQPCAWSFFQEAFPAVRDDQADLIRANRRDPRSQFVIPVRWLPVVFHRHRLGLRFNRLVRALLPIATTDTHAGTWVMARTLAREVFALQTSADFMLDLELCLVAKAQNMRQRDLPVTLSLEEEKTPQRMIHETLCILVGLPTLAWRYKRGYYHRFFGSSPMTADDWGMSPAINEGILDFVRTGRIHRVSAFAEGKYLTQGLDALHGLQTLHPDLQIGIHFNLTYGKPFRSPGQFLLQWLFSRKKLEPLIRKELASQFAALKKAGIRPQYFDSHHHVHVVPGFIRFISPLLKAEGISVVRSPLDHRLWFSPRFPLNLLALFSFREIRDSGFQSLPFVYPQRRDLFDHGRFRRLLLRNRGKEILCHPASRADASLWAFPDPYVEGRVLEYSALLMLAPEHEKNGKKETLPQ